uniref:PGG domain-containing protein n=1 Tax=Fagus sylvatica TaxID=28930 RepID=A0A2N9G1J3_FAGSY
MMGKTRQELGRPRKLPWPPKLLPLKSSNHRSPALRWSFFILNMELRKIGLGGYIMEMSRIEYGRLSLRGVLLNNHIPNMTLNTLRKLGVQERSRKESAAGDAGNATTMDEERKQANDKRQTNVLVATLIATVSFAAAFTVPGGYESNDVNKGLAVLSEKIAFKAFAIANSMAFSLSTAAVYTHFTASARSSSLTEENMLTIRACGFTSWALIALMIAFISGTYVVLPHSLAVTTAVVLCCFYFSGMVAVVV